MKEWDKKLEAELNSILKEQPKTEEDAIKIELPPLPEIDFDPALIGDPSIPESYDESMIEGLRRHLSRHGGLQSSKNTLTRLEDSVWLAAWDQALVSTANKSVLFQGSELGVFAMRTLAHGAKRVVTVEPSPLDGRIAGGIVHKNFLKAWHAEYAESILTFTEEKKRNLFNEFSSSVDVVEPDSSLIAESYNDVFVFPNIDHSLLGTGIVTAIERYRSKKGLASNARILPSRAKVFALAISWNYSSTGYNLRSLNRMRWNLYPQALDLTSDFWTAMTEPMIVGDIDFENFKEAVYTVELPVLLDGEVDAIVYWYELELDGARLDNSPNGSLKSIPPAVQDIDPIAVKANTQMCLDAHVRTHRLYFTTEPKTVQRRKHFLPSWYLARQLDSVRNDCYRAALADACNSEAPRLVLGMASDCGVLSMMAADAGARRIVACESQPGAMKISKEIVGVNGFEDSVAFIEKDVRKIEVSNDMPEKADFALVERFDCSLIGEGVLHYLSHARKKLLTNDARYLPMAAKIRAMLIEYRMDNILGVDVNILNPFRFSKSFANVDANQLDYRALTEPFDVFSFDFANAEPAADESEFEIFSISEGKAGAILFWFDLQIDEQRWISNDPSHSNPAHWKQGLQWLPEVHIQASAPLPLVAMHNGSDLKFCWKKGGFSEGDFSGLPLFDPRWLAAITELEQQTQGLMHHCMQNPEEYVKVAEIAKRFAIEPAAYDLDPKIAQRFVAAFLGL